MQNWQKILSLNFKKVSNLISYLKLKPTLAKQVLKDPSFSLNVPLRIAEKMEKNNIHDPLFRQFVPLLDENKSKKGFCLDPTKDKLFQKNKLLQKYPHRALLLCSASCSLHCRYCFRKNFHYQKNYNFSHELEILKKNTLSEIILSGGDPLMLPSVILKKLLGDLDKLPLKRIRIHTRMPIAIPERIDEEFLDILSNAKKQIIFVVHINHKKEIDDDAVEALKKIQALKIPILNQSVLLKDVNDDVKTLLELNESLSSFGVIPYYLHGLDKIQGSSHFEVSKKRGKDLIKNLRLLTSGYNIPQYVEEIPHQKSKTLIC